MAWIILANTNISILGDKAQSNEPNINPKIPLLNIKLLLLISPRRPNIKIAAEITIRYALIIHSALDI